MSEEKKNYVPCKLDMNKLIKTGLLCGAFALSIAGAKFANKWNESMKGKPLVETIDKNQAERSEDNPYPYLSLLTIGGAIACFRKLSQDEKGNSSVNAFMDNVRIALNPKYKPGAER